LRKDCDKSLILQKALFSSKQKKLGSIGIATQKLFVAPDEILIATYNFGLKFVPHLGM
jgi:hypothetical protein